MTLCAPTHHIGTRGDTLGGVNLTLEITTPMEGVIRVKTYHYKGALDDAPKFELNLYLDKQYLLGDSLLVAPVFNEDGVAEYYLPNDGGDWTDFFTGEKKEGGKWYQAQCCGCKNDTRVRKYGSDGVQKHDCCRIVKALLELQGGMEDYERWQEQELNWSAKLMWCLACSRWRKKSR